MIIVLWCSGVKQNGRMMIMATSALRGELQDSVVKVHLFKTGKRKVQIIKSSRNCEKEYSTFYLVIHKHGNSTISSAA